ncbi:MAG: phosphoribosylaminoimidazolesuccinocarboxamide synthase [Firmicutes bacterium]|nr:phosphoribosylaminoimidazolesuccinocarboxamide synthase [Bacillota bacterium]
MEFIKHGKTKDVYRLADENILLRFKDTVTGHASTGESDPGGNEVVGTKEGVGVAALKMTTYYFQKLKEMELPTHWVSSNLAKSEMIVRSGTMFGNGLEFVVRYIASGSFIRRFGAFIKEGDNLGNGIYEITLKDDLRNDPPATVEIIEALGLMSKQQLKDAEILVKKVCDFVKDDLANKGLVLVDIKVEVGLVDGKVVLVDEISGGNMRVTKNSQQLDYVTLSNYF